jgi:hypothetical protein
MPESPRRALQSLRLARGIRVLSESQEALGNQSKGGALDSLRDMRAAQMQPGGDEGDRVLLVVPQAQELGEAAGR